MSGGWRRKTAGALLLCAASFYLLADYPNNNVLISWSTTGSRSAAQPSHLCDQCVLPRATVLASAHGETAVVVTEPPLTQMSRPPLVPHKSSVANIRRRHVGHIFKGQGRTTPAMHRQQWPPLVPEESAETLPMHSDYRPNVTAAPVSHHLTCPSHTTLLIAVLSTPSDVLKRHAIRFTWGYAATDIMGWPNRLIKGHIRLVFIVGQAENADEKRVLEGESLKFNDILFTNVSESYRNLTYKTLFVMDWFTRQCNPETFLLKSDDDMFLNVPHLLDLVTSFRSRDVVIGHIHSSSIVLRSGPWSVPHSLYPQSTFPPYAAGNAYVISGGVVGRLVKAAKGRPVLPVEDAYITGVLRSAINVTIVHRAGFAKWRSARPHPCDFLRDRVYTGTRVTTQYMRRIWDVLVQNGPCL